MTFQEALDARLSLMGVSRKQVEAFLADHPPRLSKGARPLSKLSVGNQNSTAVTRCFLLQAACHDRYCRQKTF